MWQAKNPAQNADYSQSDTARKASWAGVGTEGNSRQMFVGGTGKRRWEAKQNEVDTCGLLSTHLG